MYDDVITIEGGRPLRGEVPVHGAKNAVLPVLSAALLAPRSVIRGCPSLSDVAASRRILEHLGCRCAMEGDVLTVDARDASGCGIPAALAGGMRGSIIFLGALLARFGRAQIALPGGCRLGPRPIDLHIGGLRRMGARIIEQEDGLICSVDGTLRGAEIPLRYPSVGATENLLLAAVLAQGETFLRGAAREPEIDCLIRFLQSAGARVRREPEGIRVEGVPALRETDFQVIPDRIEAVTYLCAAAATGGEILLRHAGPAHLTAVLPVLEGMGCTLRVEEDTLYLRAPERLRPVENLSTGPYPAFPTDALPPVMIPALLARGQSRFTETVFDGRYLHVPQLLSMGAKVTVEGPHAIVTGVEALHGAPLRCTDLRGGAALLLAALAAQGTSTLSELSHIRRGYAQLPETLSALGAKALLCSGAEASPFAGEPPDCGAGKLPSHDGREAAAV